MFPKIPKNELHALKVWFSEGVIQFKFPVCNVAETGVHKNFLVFFESVPFTSLEIGQKINSYLRP